MSERGVFAVDRGIWDHDLFSSEEPLSRREAWLWLISAASWKKRTIRVGGAPAEIDRGQLTHSIRFMAEAWNWPKTNVARFLDQLEHESLIGTETVHGQTIITICKYDEFQRVSLPDRDNSGTQTGTEVGQKWDKEEDIKYIEEGKRGANAPTPIRELGKPPAKRPRRSGEGCLIPDDFALSDKMRQYAASRNLVGVYAEQLFSKFCNNARAKGVRYLNWEAGWRTWVDRQVEWNSQAQQQASPRRHVVI